MTPQAHDLATRRDIAVCPTCSDPGVVVKFVPEEGCWVCGGTETGQMVGGPLLPAKSAQDSETPPTRYSHPVTPAVITIGAQT